MKKIIILLSLLISLSCHSQMPVGKVLVADETEYVPSGKSAFRIVTSNDSIYVKIFRRFIGKELYRITNLAKEDRRGKYWETSFYFKNEHYNAVVRFINNDFKESP